MDYPNSNPYSSALCNALEKSGWTPRPASDGFYKTIVHPERLSSYFINILNLSSDCYIEIRKFDQKLQRVVYCQQYHSSIPEIMSGGEGYFEDLLIRADNEYLDGRYIDMRNRSVLQ